MKKLLFKKILTAFKSKGNNNSSLTNLAHILKDRSGFSKITLRYRNVFLKYTIDGYENVFLAAEYEFDICFSPSRLYLAVHKVEIFSFL